MRRAARFAGVSLDAAIEDSLERFARWLVEEAIPAGGLGPQEGAVLERRHLADSLTFAVGWRDGPRPRTLLDLGSGVGLPGIVLAIACPDLDVVLVDRSGRRVRLAQRALRVLGLDNVTPRHQDLDDLTLQGDAVVARGVKAPRDLLPVLRRCTAPGGVAIVGGSHRQPPSVAGYRTITVPAWVLDQPSWLLMMAPP